MHALMLVSPANIMQNERSQMQKTRYCMIQFIRSTQNAS